jgi:hypothetical protein
MPEDGVPLREHLEALINAHDRRYEQRFGDQATAVQAALNAAKEAVLKAETAAEKRFESVNEFRETLDDQQRTLIPRAEAELRMNAIAARVDEVAKVVDAGRSARAGGREMWAYVVGGIGLLFGILSFASGLWTK